MKHLNAKVLICISVCVGIIALMITQFVSSTSYANTHEPSRIIMNGLNAKYIHPESDDGDPGSIPIPFSSTNQKVELADEEVYTLVGAVAFINDRPHLKIDLEFHPWLATTYRMAFPFYPLTWTTLTTWQRLKGQKIRGVFRAKSQISRVANNNDSKYAHTITLKILHAPDIFSTHDVTYPSSTTYNLK